MANKVSNDQLDTLLDFLSEHPTIAKGVGLGARSKETIDKQWNDLAKKLNSFGNGSTKSGERWKKYWVDLKHKCKTRLSKRKREALGTGGGPSSQDELSDVDQKVLAIIGEQAVFGDSVHRVPVFNIETEQNEEGQRDRENMVYPKEIIITDSATKNLSEVVDSSSVLVHSPSRRGHTSQVYSTIEYDPTAGQHSITDTTVRETPLQTGMESPVTRPIADRRRLRASRNRAANATIPSRINPEWVMELEKSRVEADTKLANAALIMAESARAQAETACAQADLTRQLVTIVRQQSDDIKALLVMLRDKQQ